MAQDPAAQAPSIGEEVMTDLVPDSAPVPSGPLARISYLLGAIGLLAATASDAIAVAGRHSGFHLLGSIELVQAAVVLLASSAMLLVTIAGGHASVHIVTERLPKPTAARLARGAALVSAVLFVIFAIGSAVLLGELWNGYERTELLHIPLRWLRLLWTLFAVAIAVQFIRNALRKPA